MVLLGMPSPGLGTSPRGRVRTRHVAGRRPRGGDDRDCHRGAAPAKEVPYPWRPSSVPDFVDAFTRRTARRRP